MWCLVAKLKLSGMGKVMKLKEIFEPYAAYVRDNEPTTLSYQLICSDKDPLTVTIFVTAARFEREREILPQSRGRDAPSPQSPAPPPDCPPLHPIRRISEFNWAVASLWRQERYECKEKAYLGVHSASEEFKAFKLACEPPAIRTSKLQPCALPSAEATLPCRLLRRRRSTSKSKG